MDDIKPPSYPRPKHPSNDGPPIEPDIDSSKTQNPVEEIFLDNNQSINMTKFSNTPYKTSKKSRFSLSKKRVIIILIIFALIIAGIIFVLSQQEDTQQSTQNTVVKEEKPAPPPPPKSKLTGLTLENSTLAERPVTGMMIENSPDSRPQSGLLQADMVFEAIAEGGVTRFLATYQESTPDYIGPVRSARPYYIDYILGLDGSYGHVGGSPEALQDIKTLGVKDLDQFFNPSGYYRISSRYAPHNMYTDFSRIDTMNQQKGYTKSEFKPLERKPDVPQTPTAKVIKLNLSGPNYNPTFTYDTANNIYLRSQAGSPHTDQKSGEQIKSKAVVALVTEKGNGSDGYHSSYKTTGSGKVFVFQDGVVSEGTWSKADRKASLVLTDKYGLPLKLTAGKTWITLVGSTSDVRYSAQ